MIFNGFTEDIDGNLYLCGTVQRKAGLIIKIGNGGNYIWKADSLFGSLYSMDWSKDSLFVLSAGKLSPYTPGSIGLFDNKGNFLKQVVDTGYGSSFVIDNGRFLILGQTQGVSLYKRTFFATSNITLKRFTSNGKIDTAYNFDFGKYENSISLQKFGNGFLMITKSDETVNMGTNYFNYFVTKLDSSLSKVWQIHFGTDSTGLAGNQHYRVFASDNRGTVLATNNDTLFKYTDVTEIRDVQFLHNGNTNFHSNSLFKVYDLQGRLLLKYSSGSLHSVQQMKISGISKGLKILSSDRYSESGTKVYCSDK